MKTKWKNSHPSGPEETAQRDTKHRLDTGLGCLVMIARFHGLAADPAQIKHAFAIGENGMGMLDIIRAYINIKECIPAENP